MLGCAQPRSELLPAENVKAPLLLSHGFKSYLHAFVHCILPPPTLKPAKTGKQYNTLKLLLFQLWLEQTIVAQVLIK